jgi:hypothetical protein
MRRGPTPSNPADIHLRSRFATNRAPSSSVNRPDRPEIGPTARGLWTQRTSSADVAPLRGFNHWFALTTPSRLACRTRAVWAVPARPVVVGAAPTNALRFQGQAAPSFSDPLRRAAVGSLIPLDHRRLVAHSALAAYPGLLAQGGQLLTRPRGPSNGQRPARPAVASGCPHPGRSHRTHRPRRTPPPETVTRHGQHPRLFHTGYQQRREPQPPDPQARQDPRPPP